MSTKNYIATLTIKGFKSIKDLNNPRLHNLNVLIGGNGVRKSDFIDCFRMLDEVVESRLQHWTTQLKRRLEIVGSKSLSLWLRDKFFEQHCKLFQHRPFIWHIWDGLKDGFSVLRSEEHTSELQSRPHLVCRLLLEKKKICT